MDLEEMNAEEYRFLYELEEDHWWFVGMRRIVAALLDPFILPSPLRVLDVGCGTGLMLSWWREHRGAESVFGADISPVALQFYTRRGLRLLAQASVTGLPFVRPLPKGLRWLNLLLAGVLAFEAAWLRYIPWQLPFGLSLIAVARKGSGQN